MHRAAHVGQVLLKIRKLRRTAVEEVSTGRSAEEFPSVIVNCAKYANMEQCQYRIRKEATLFTWA